METIKEQDIINFIDAFVKLDPSVEFSTGHIVLSDYNIYDTAIEYCLSITPNDDKVYLFLSLLKNILDNNEVID